MNAGTATTTTHAPSVNFDTRKTIVATAVMTAPMPLMAARYRQRRGRSRRQCTTRPVWESVNPVKTPMAKRGISVFVLPRTASRSTPDITESAPMPNAKVWRSPRRAKR